MSLISGLELELLVFLCLQTLRPATLSTLSSTMLSGLPTGGVLQQALFAMMVLLNSIVGGLLQ